MSDRHALPSLNALRAFEAAARLGGVSPAAAELHVTHGAVSRQVRLLEEDLGVRLFDRQGRGLVLTDAGERLRAAAAAAFEPLRSACAQLRQGPRNEALVLGCPGSLLARWVIPRLDRLARDLPQLRLHLAASERVPDAALSGLDAALLLAEPPLPASWRSFALAGEQIGPVLSPAYAASAGLEGQPVDALLKLPLLHTQSRPQAWPDWARAHDLAADELRLGQGFEHLYYLLEAAVAGLGVAIAPRQLVADELRSGRLLAPWGFAPTAGRWWLCAPVGREDPRLPALVEWLRGQLHGDESGG